MFTIFPKDRYRSKHIPLANVRQEEKTIQIRDIASATFTRGADNLLHKITSTRPYTVTQAEEFSPATLSFILYNDESLWWVICAYNGIVFPTTELYAGRIIKVPEKSELLNLLTEAQSSTLPSKEKFVKI